MESSENKQKETVENTCSIREFARCAKVSDTAIRKAIEKGRISAEAVKQNKQNGRPELLYELALKDWLAVGGTMHQTPKFLNENIQPLKHAESLAVDKKPANLFTDAAAKEKEEKIVGEGLGAYSIANTRSVVLKSEILEIELMQKRGILVNKEKVYKNLFDFGKTMREKFLAIPDRYIDDIFSSTDRNEAHTKLYTAINECLEYLSSNAKIS